MGHNSVINSSKFVGKNPNLDLVHISVNAKFSQDPFIHSQNIKLKQNFDNNQGPQLCNELMKMDT